MDITTAVVTIAVCLFGSGGIVIWVLNRHAQKDGMRQDITDIKDCLHELKEGLLLALQNDKIIFEALRKNSINGESEKQDKRMDEYFLKSSSRNWSTK